MDTIVVLWRLNTTRVRTVCVVAFFSRTRDEQQIFASFDVRKVEAPAMRDCPKAEKKRLLVTVFLCVIWNTRWWKEMVREIVGFFVLVSAVI